MSNNLADLDAEEYMLKESREHQRQIFGPILDSAFVNNRPARILLTKAINQITGNNIREAEKLLKGVQECCCCEGDQAAWMFFRALCFGLRGHRETMLAWYERLEKYHHRFYWPYLELAMEAHSKQNDTKAKEYYQICIDCILEMPEKDRNQKILDLARTNLNA